VINYLLGLVGTKAKLTLEVQAEVPNDIPKDWQSIVNEKCRA
jgi:hypothetical protein